MTTNLFNVSSGMITAHTLTTSQATGIIEWLSKTDPLNFIVATFNLVVAVAALLVAKRALCLTTRHVVKIIEASAPGSLSISRPDFYSCLNLYFKNLGLAIPKMTVSIQFCGENRFGRANFPLQAIQEKSPDDVLTPTVENVSTGMIVNFGKRSYAMSNDELSFILTLKDFRKQKAVICVNCTGYLVETIEIDTFQDRLRRHYGRMIALIQRTLKLGICAKDQKSWKARLFSNSTKSLVVVMEEFLSSLRAEQIRRQQQKS